MFAGRQARRRGLKGLRIAVMAVPVLFVVFAVGFVLSPSVSDWLSRQEFDADRWKAWSDTEEDCCLRWQMVHDLTTESNLVGMKRMEVIALLGEPDSEDHNGLYYNLGMTGHGIDSGTLMLYLNDSGVVERYAVWRG